MNLCKFSFWYSAETVSLRRQLVAKIYVSQGRTGIDRAYTTVPERVILMYAVACEVEILSNGMIASMSAGLREQIVRLTVY
jgi:hypothetical protein